MSTTVADLRAKISVDGADKAKSDLKGVGESANKTKSDLGGMGGVMGGLKDAFVGGLGAIAGALTGLGVASAVGDALGFVKDQLTDIIAQAESQQAVMAQTAAVLRSTGGAAGITTDEVGDLSDALARQTGIADDTVQSVTNVLLTFTNLKANVLPQTTGLVLDLATAMHEDFNSAAIQVGKALNDPIQGVTALRRVGVQLSQQQEDAVKHFMAVGNVAAAQKVIMGELSKEVGGSADAYGKTFPGMVARFNVSLDQAKEKIGLAVLPVLQDMLTRYVMPLADWIGDHLPAAIQVLTTFLQNDFAPAVDAIMKSPVVQTIEGWAQAFGKTLPPAVDTATGKLGSKGLAGGAEQAQGSLKNLSGQAKTTGTDIDPTFTKQVNAGIESVTGLAVALDGPESKNPALTPAMSRYESKLKQLDAAQQRATKTQSQSIPVISGIGDLFGRAGEKIGGFVDDIKKRLPGAMPQIQRFGDFLGGVFGPDGALPGLQTMWEGFWSFLSFPVRAAFESVHNIFNVGLDLLNGDFDKAGKDAQKGTQKIGDIVKDGLAGLGKFLIGPFEAGLGGIIGAVQHFPDLFAPEFTKAWQSLLISAGKDIDNFGLHLLQQLQIWADRIIDTYNNTIGSLPGMAKAPRLPIIQLPSGGGRTPGTGKRARGGPTSGIFEGAEEGPELLLTHGMYYAPPGSYVVDAQKTAQILSGGSGGRGSGGGGGNTYITVNGADYNSAMDIARKVQRQQQRMQLLTGMGGR